MAGSIKIDDRSVKVVLTMSGRDARRLERELLLTMFSPKGGMRADYEDTIMADLYYVLPSEPD
jgi:hypothetical protein